MREVWRVSGPGSGRAGNGARGGVHALQRNGATGGYAAHGVPPVHDESGQWVEEDTERACSVESKRARTQTTAHTHHPTCPSAYSGTPPAFPPAHLLQKDAIRGGSVQSPSTHHALKKLSLFMPFHPVKKLAFDVAAGASRR